MINLYNQDCMIALKNMKDNQYDLAIVDPPYGGGNNYNFRFSENENKKIYDNVRPKPEYFKELFRVSKEQIIWGGNYFTNDLPESRGWICWDKKQPLEGTSFSNFELAWTSFDKIAKMVVLANAGFNHADKRIRGESTIHPTQKPVSLYEWQLRNYTKKPIKILDTHLGSGSIAIACHNLGYSLDGYEVDEDYFLKAKKRLNQHRTQTQLWT